MGGMKWEGSRGRERMERRRGKEIKSRVGKGGGNGTFSCGRVGRIKSCSIEQWGSSMKFHRKHRPLIKTASPISF